MLWRNIYGRASDVGALSWICIRLMERDVLETKR